MNDPWAEDLLRHQRFLLRLAARLAGPELEPQDLVQEAFVRALERPPDSGGSARAWLATVLRRSAGRSRRGARRRAEREELAARPECDSPESRIDARIAAQAELVALLRNLPGGERQALFLRYADELGPPEIAALLGLPLETVRTRLRRGRERLRARLDARHEGRAAWLALLMPAGVPGGDPSLPTSAAVSAGGSTSTAASAATLSAAGVLMATTAKILLGAAACTALLFFWTRPADEAETRAALAPSAADDELAARASEAEAANAAEPPLREAAPTGHAREVDFEFARPALTPAAASWPVLVRAEGATAAGARIRASARLDVFGRYDAPAVEGVIDGSNELLLDLGAHLAELLAHADGARPEELVVELDHPALCPTQASLVLPDPLELDAPPARPPVVVVKVSFAAIVVGRLVTLDGRAPAGDAWVQAHARRGETIARESAGFDVPDERGAFRLRIDGEGAHALLALAGELRPGTLRAELVRGATLDLGEVVLGPGLAIDGRALDLAGAVREGANVFAMLLGTQLLIERARYALELTRTLAWHEGAFELFVCQAKTAADGSFRMVGLGPHRYELDTHAEEVEAPFALDGKPEARAPATVELRPQAAELRLDLRFPGDIACEGTGVWTRGAERRELRLSPWMFEEGRVRRYALPPDESLHLRLAFDGLAPVELALATPGVGGIIERELWLERDLAAARLVLALRGAPVADGTPFVAVLRRGKDVRELELELQGGELVLDDLRPGELTLVLSAGRDRFAPQDHLRDLVLPLRLAAGEERRIEVELAYGGTLVLEALDPDGARVAARCTVRDAAGEALELVFVARIPEGRVAGPGRLFPGGPSRAVPELPPGRYRATIEAAGFEPEELLVVIEAGATTRRSVALRRSN